MRARMPQYTLTYFDFSGSRGEDCRLALHVAGVEFVDKRVARAQWPALKPQTPYGSVPVLHAEGKPDLAQSNAILTYVGRSYGLHPRDNWTAAVHEAILESVEELRAALAPSGRVADPVEKQRLREEFVVQTLRPWAARIEQQLQSPFVSGEQLCVADIKLFTMLHSFIGGTIDHITAEAFQPFPKLLKLYAAVKAHPKIAEWRARSL